MHTVENKARREERLQQHRQGPVKTPRGHGFIGKGSPLSGLGCDVGSDLYEAPGDRVSLNILLLENPAGTGCLEAWMGHGKDKRRTGLQQAGKGSCQGRHAAHVHQDHVGQGCITRTQGHQRIRLILSVVMSDLAVASPVNSIADKVDTMSIEPDDSLDALRELELIGDILTYSSQREPIRSALIGSHLYDIRQGECTQAE